MSVYYDDDPLDNPNVQDYLGNEVEIEEYKEDEEISEEQEPQMIAPRIIAGQEDRIHWQIDTCGTAGTTAEGTLGKKMRKANIISRTPEQRFCDNIINICREADISYGIRDAVLKLNSIIPDIRYKSAAGILYGFLAMNAVGNTEKSVNKKEFDSVIRKMKQAPTTVVKINELDVIRYALLLKKLLKKK